MKRILNTTTVGFIGLAALILSDTQSHFETSMAHLRAPASATMEEVFVSTELTHAVQEEIAQEPEEAPKYEEAIKALQAYEEAQPKPQPKKVVRKLRKKKIVRIAKSEKKHIDRQLAKIGELTLQKADDGKRFADACTGFIQRDGHYGKIGKELVKNMKKKPYLNKYLSTQSLNQLCPNYKSLKAQQKLQAWVWFWMVLSNEESSCQVETPHGTHAKVAGHWIRINPKEGYGLFAAELYGGDRQWRGPMCQGSMKKMNVQVSCAVHTMYDRHLSEGQGAYTASSYWGPVRRLDKQIVPNMGLYKPCFEGSNYVAAKD